MVEITEKRQFDDDGTDHGCSCFHRWKQSLLWSITSLKILEKAQKSISRGYRYLETTAVVRRYSAKPQLRNFA